jgi:hypothetical protein
MHVEVLWGDGASVLPAATTTGEAALDDGSGRPSPERPVSG